MIDLVVLSVNLQFLHATEYVRYMCVNLASEHHKPDLPNFLLFQSMVTIYLQR